MLCIAQIRKSTRFGTPFRYGRVIILEGRIAVTVKQKSSPLFVSIIKCENYTINKKGYLRNGVETYH